jgi:hypothetical protein
MIFVRISFACLVVICINEPPVAVFRCFLVFLLRPIKKCWRRTGSGKERLGPESKIFSNRSQVLPMESFFSYLKFLISARSLATLLIGKNLE